MINENIDFVKTTPFAECKECPVGIEKAGCATQYEACPAHSIDVSVIVSNANINMCKNMNITSDKINN